MGECKIEDVKNSTVYVEAVFNFLIFSSSHLLIFSSSLCSLRWEKIDL